MTRSGPLVVLAIGLIAFIAGVGRLAQHYSQPDQPDAVPVPVFYASAILGLLVVLVATTAVARDFASRGRVSAARLWLGIALFVGVLTVAYLAGANAGR